MEEAVVPWTIHFYLISSVRKLLRRNCLTAIIIIYKLCELVPLVTELTSLLTDI